MGRVSLVLCMILGLVFIAGSLFLMTKNRWQTSALSASHPAIIEDHNQPFTSRDNKPGNTQTIHQAVQNSSNAAIKEKGTTLSLFDLSSEELRLRIIESRVQLSTDQREAILELFRKEAHLKEQKLPSELLTAELKKLPSLESILGSGSAATYAIESEHFRNDFAAEQLSGSLLALSKNAIFNSEERNLITTIVAQADSEGLDYDARWLLFAEVLSDRLSQVKFQFLEKIFNRAQPAENQLPDLEIVFPSAEVARQYLERTKNKLGLNENQARAMEDLFRRAEQLFKLELEREPLANSANSRRTKLVKEAYSKAQTYFDRELSLILNKEQLTQYQVDQAKSITQRFGLR